MATRIFEVEYWFTETYDSKSKTKLREVKSVTAKNAADALIKVASLLKKPTSYIDDETKKKVVVARSNFDPINVNLEAEAD